MVEKGVRDGICHATQMVCKSKIQFYKKIYDKNIESSYVMYLDANNLHGWVMPQNCLQMVLNGRKTKFDEDFVKSYDMDSNKGYTLEIDVKYSKNLLNLHGDRLLLAERKQNRCKKLVCNINDK